MHIYVYECDWQQIKQANDRECWGVRGSFKLFLVCFPKFFDHLNGHVTGMFARSQMKDLNFSFQMINAAMSDANHEN